MTLDTSAADFVAEMQAGLLRAKSEWAAKLEDFGHKISNTSTHGGGGNKSVHAQQSKAAATPLSTAVTPFRVLLQLFAYEDVLENGKLDAAFDADDGEALTFYVPQLLSFLLHGALYCSPVLEEWILQKCRRNVYFAHRCYWFLRAWCLEVPAEARAPTVTTPLSLSRRSSFNSLTGGGNNNNSNSGSVAGLQPFLDEPAANEADPHDGGNRSSGNSCRQLLPDRTSSVVPVALSSSHHQLSISALPQLDKFLPEERAMIERLMMRVKECGEESARSLEFGSTVVEEDDNDDHAEEPEVTPHNNKQGSSYDQKDSVVSSSSYEPIRSPPRNGGGVVESRLDIPPQREGLTRRLTSTASSRSRSRSPSPPSRSASLTVQASTTSMSSDYEHSPAAIVAAAEAGKIPVDPGTGYPSVKHFDAIVSRSKAYGFRSGMASSPMKQFYEQHHSETEQFDKTPQFLDALIFLAENLFLIPREERRETLHQQLRSLECELLPSNSVYLPIGNSHHRVWRVVPEESIPISTKERVPCIVALEVIDYSPSKKRREPRGAWNALLGLPKKAARAVTSEVSPPTPAHASPTALTSAASMPITSSTHTASSVESAAAEKSENAPESEILSQWRFGRRDPLRRVSLLDKMTTTVKVPFDKMKTQVRDHINQLRDRAGSSEELQALSLPEYAVDPEQPPLSSSSAHQENDPLDSSLEFSRRAALSDAENGAAGRKTNGISAAGNGSPITTKAAHSRNNSAGSIVSLGQWSSPVPANSSSQAVKDSELRRNLNDLRARLDAELPGENKSRTSPLPYGSDQEDDPNERSSSSHGLRPPRSLKRSSLPVAAAKGGEMTLSSSDAAAATKDGSTTKSTRPPPVVFRESWDAKQERIRKRSAFGDHPGWRLLPILIKANDDLRQEQLAAQLIQRMAAILAREKVPVWLCPNEIIALTDTAGIIEAIPDTISLDSLKKNGPEYTNLNDFFCSHFGEGTVALAGAKANFVESLAAYSIVCFLLQIKDRHNGNILLDKWGHIIHIDFGFFFLSSPGKNVGFESAPFKLTRDFVEVLDGPDSHLFRTFRELCVKTFLTLRKRCMEIILLVEMLKSGNEELNCFRGRPDDAIQQLRERFRLDLNDRACREYVQSLVDDSIENWRTDWYDRYQRYFVGVL